MEPADTLEVLKPDPPGAAARSAAASGARAAPEVTLTESRDGMWRTVARAWHERVLLARLGQRFLAKFVHGTKLGRLWLVIRPLMDSLGKTLLFGSVLKVQSPGAAPYYLFLMSGLLGWRLFERTAKYSTRSFSMYSKLMKSFHFPLLLVPLAAMAYPVLEILIYWLVFLGAVGFFWIVDGQLYLQGPPQLLLVIPGVALVLASTVGLGLWTSVLNAKARDTRFLIRYVLPVWLYLTPVVYPISQLPANLRWLGTINPMSAPIEMMKAGLIDAGYFDFTAVACSVGFNALLLLSGLWFFSREAARSIDAYGGIDDEEEDL
jgi:lipopolysaccharide transport system permease protein